MRYLSLTLSVLVFGISVGPTFGQTCGPNGCPPAPGTNSLFLPTAPNSCPGGSCPGGHCPQSLGQKPAMLPMIAAPPSTQNYYAQQPQAQPQPMLQGYYPPQQGYTPSYPIGYGQPQPQQQAEDIFFGDYGNWNFIPGYNGYGGYAGG